MYLHETSKFVLKQTSFSPKTFIDAPKTVNFTTFGNIVAWGRIPCAIFTKFLRFKCNKPKWQLLVRPRRQSVRAHVRPPT